MTKEEAPIHEEFASRLREARSLAGLTQRQLADQLGISHTQVARYERGLSLPRPRVLVDMATALAVPLTHLRDSTPVKVVHFVNEKDEVTSSISLSAEEFAQIEHASLLSGVSVGDVIRNIILTGVNQKAVAAGLIPPPKKTKEK